MVLKMDLRKLICKYKRRFKNIVWWPDVCNCGSMIKLNNKQQTDQLAQSQVLLAELKQVQETDTGQEQTADKTYI